MLKQTVRTDAWCVCVYEWMAAWMDLLQPKNCHMGQDNFKIAIIISAFD